MFNRIRPVYCVLIGGETQWEFKVEQFWGTFMTLGYLRWCNFILLRNIKDKYRLLLHNVGVCCSCVADKDLTCKRRNSIFGAVIGGLAWQRSTTTERFVSLTHLPKASACRNSTFSLPVLIQKASEKDFNELWQAAKITGGRNIQLIFLKKTIATNITIQICR